MRRLLLLSFCLTIVATTVIAQDPGLPGGDPDAPVPIDGGIFALLAAGIGYGLKKMKTWGHHDDAGKKQKTP